MSAEHSTLTQLLDEVKPYRQSESSLLLPLFLNRWSPRAYSDRKVSDQDLLTVLEAAHWAPSSFNDQPWRFFVAKTPEQLELFHSFINEFNSWSFKAPVLILIGSDKLRANGDPNGPHTFDSGTAWGYLALQAKILGLDTHAIGGFDRAKARTVLNVPDQIEFHAVITLGYQGDKNQLPERVRQREVPNTRCPLSEVIYEGKVKP
jgi:nitroreductase